MKRTSIQATKIKDYNVQIYDFQILVFLLNLFSEILTLKLSSPVLGEKKKKQKQKNTCCCVHPQQQVAIVSAVAAVLAQSGSCHNCPPHENEKFSAVMWV